MAIIQARMNSSRLPGKVLKPILGRPMLAWQIERVRRASRIDEVVVATSDTEADNLLAGWCVDNGLPCFRGSEHDVLSRYYGAAVAFRADVVVRLTGDCPLIDPAVVDKVADEYLRRAGAPHTDRADYVSNIMERTYPRGMDTEAFSFRCLEQAWKEAAHPEEREHVTPFIYRTPERFRLNNVAYSTDESVHRWTVDTPEDFALVSRLIEVMLAERPHFILEDLLSWVHDHPALSAINAHIVQKPVAHSGAARMAKDVTAGGGGG